MARWRIGRGWTDEELAAHLEALRGAPRNFSDPIEERTSERGWHRYASEAVIARSRPGEPEEGGLFARGRRAVTNYAFSDPRIVIAHFNAEEPLLGRTILLEMRALRVLHYLGGTVVGAVRDESTAARTVFGFRYDTLEGHIEEGVEWFLLSKEHETGAIRFRIAATWRPGQFPNWWSRLGFALLGKYYQERWHRRAHRLMARLVHTAGAGAAVPGRAGLVHSDPEVIFERTRAHHA